jgi:hypothetical protein
MHKRKNNTPNRIGRSLLIVAMVSGVVVLIWLAIVLTHPHFGRNDDPFFQTKQAIEATNYAETFHIILTMTPPYGMAHTMPTIGLPYPTISPTPTITIHADHTR